MTNDCILISLKNVHCTLTMLTLNKHIFKNAESWKRTTVNSTLNTLISYILDGRTDALLCPYLQ